MKGDIEGPEQYPEGLEKKFRDLRMFALDDLIKEIPEPEAAWDQLAKNGKYLTNTQLKYVLAHLGLSGHALVNAPSTDAPQKEEGVAGEKQKFEFFRDLMQQSIVRGDIVAMVANDQLELIFHWMVDRVPLQTMNKLRDIFYVFVTEFAGKTLNLCYVVKAYICYSVDIPSIR